MFDWLASKYSELASQSDRMSQSHTFFYVKVMYLFQREYIKITNLNEIRKEDMYFFDIFYGQGFDV